MCCTFRWRTFLLIRCPSYARNHQLHVFPAGIFPPVLPDTLKAASYFQIIMSFLECVHCLSQIYVFYIHGSVHRNSILIRSNKMPQYAGIYLLQNYSTCFGCLSHPSSGVHKTVTAASGTGHSI